MQRNEGQEMLEFQILWKIYKVNIDITTMIFDNCS